MCILQPQLRVQLQIIRCSLVKPTWASAGLIPSQLRSSMWVCAVPSELAKCGNELFTHRNLHTKRNVAELLRSCPGGAQYPRLSAIHPHTCTCLALLLFVTEGGRSLHRAAWLLRDLSRVGPEVGRLEAETVGVSRSLVIKARTPPTCLSN